MANILQRFAEMVGASIAGYLTPEHVEKLKQGKLYYEGVQKTPLKTKPGQMNDSLVANFVGLAVDRANSMLFGGGVNFVASDPGQQEFLNVVWDANKKPILLHRTGLDGELFGTPYVKIIPGALEWEGVMLPRLVLLDPTLMSIVTDPMDIEQVNAYVFEMSLPDGMGVREVTRRVTSADGEIIRNDGGFEEPAAAGWWVVEKWERASNQGNWTLRSSTVWPYEFSPILHWQNLPSVHGVYGMRGIEGVTEIQDKYNFVISNVLKIIRYHAHPKTWARGVPAGTNAEKVSWGGDEMIKFTSTDAMVANLEMGSDGSVSRLMLQDLRQTIFDLCRVVDISSITDRIGSLTNFGLRVLYSDALSKNATRRQLYGDAFEELCRRLLLLAGANDGARVRAEWGSDLPQDEREDAELVHKDLLAGIVSRETAATRRGYQWNTPDDGETPGEQDRIANEKAAEGDAANNALARLFAGTETP